MNELSRLLNGAGLDGAEPLVPLCKCFFALDLNRSKFSNKFVHECVMIFKSFSKKSFLCGQKLLQDLTVPK